MLQILTGAPVCLHDVLVAPRHLALAGADYFRNLRRVFGNHPPQILAELLYFFFALLLALQDEFAAVEPAGISEGVGPEEQAYVGLVE